MGRGLSTRSVPATIYNILDFWNILGYHVTHIVTSTALRPRGKQHRQARVICRSRQPQAAALFSVHIPSLDLEIRRAIFWSFLLLHFTPPNFPSILPASSYLLLLSSGYFPPPIARISSHSTLRTGSTPLCKTSTSFPRRARLLRLLLQALVHHHTPALGLVVG